MYYLNVEQYVARQMQLKAEEVELLVSKDVDRAISKTSTEKMQSLQDDETLAKLKVDCISSHGYMVLSLLLVSIIHLI